MTSTPIDRTLQNVTEGAESLEEAQERVRTAFERDPKEGVEAAQQVLEEFLPGLTGPFMWLVWQLRDAKSHGGQKPAAVAIAEGRAAAAVGALMRAGHSLDDACARVSAVTRGHFSRDGEQLWEHALQCRAAIDRADLGSLVEEVGCCRPGRRQLESGQR